MSSGEKVHSVVSDFQKRSQSSKGVKTTGLSNSTFRVMKNEILVALHTLKENNHIAICSGRC